MKMLYISVHGILEYDEMRMFNDMGIQLFSPSGNYETREKSSPYRPTIPNLNMDTEDLNAYYKYWYLWNWDMVCPKEFVDRFDVIYVMGLEKFIVHNWETFQRKPVIWRTIGQSNPSIEKQMGDFRKTNSNLKIVRYSPTERNLQNYAGEDAVIRFSKRSDEWKGWNGDQKNLVTVVQSMKRRGFHCGWDIFEKMTKYLPCKLYGGDNPEVNPPLFCGSPTLDELKNVYRDNRSYFYAGTIPSNYTLNFIEAWMTGIPIVALGQGLVPDGNKGVYEIPTLIENGYNGFVVNNTAELYECVKVLFNDDKLAKFMSENGRERAIYNFEESKIVPQWKEFFSRL